MGTYRMSQKHSLKPANARSRASNFAAHTLAVLLTVSFKSAKSLVLPAFIVMGLFIWPLSL